jgi:regulator of RNase E activity RraA
MNRTFRTALMAAVLLAVPGMALAQTQGFMTREQVIHNTAYWTGERFADGRPKVSDELLDRLKNVTHEEAWATLRSAGFYNQYEDGWQSLFPEKVQVGRVLTSGWMPARVDIGRIIEADGIAAGRKNDTNAWPVDMLQKRDVYVSDHFGLKVGGPSIGDNVGNAIYAKTGNGIVYDGAVRDVNGLRKLPDFVSFWRSYDPSHHYGMTRTGANYNSTLVSINAPTRIGKVTVMPGDVTLGRDGAVMFIPPQLVERVVRDSERTQLRDQFGQLRIREGKYTAGQIDGGWAPEIEADYDQWLKANVNKLGIPASAVQAIITERANRPASGRGGRGGPPGAPGAGPAGPGRGAPQPAQ